MKKAKTEMIIGFGIIFLFLMVGFCSAQTLWEFQNFVNKYQVYYISLCNVQGTSSCASELGWQGFSSNFIFNINSINISALPNKINFTMQLYDVLSEKPMDVLVNGKVIASNYVVKNPPCSGNICPLGGAHVFQFDKSYLKQGKANVITLVVKNLRIGYGQPSQGFVMTYVSLKA